MGIDLEGDEPGEDSKCIFLGVRFRRLDMEWVLMCIYTKATGVVGRMCVEISERGEDVLASGR